MPHAIDMNKETPSLMLECSCIHIKLYNRRLKMQRRAKASRAPVTSNAGALCLPRCSFPQNQINMS